MRFRQNRTLLAGVLLSFTVALPCAAWFFAGSFQAQMEAERMVAKSIGQGKELLAKLAISTNEQLERLLENETARPFYHYQTHYLDPHSSIGATVVRSPLASGPGHPLVQAYFQVDPDKRVSLPTLIGNTATECSKACEDLQRAIRRGLTCDAGKCSSQLQRVAFGAQPAAERISHIERFSRCAWERNLDTKLRRCTKAVDHESKSIEVQLGPFLWSTLDLGERETLVALRRVATPVGPFVQGFVVDSGAIEKQLAAAAPVAFRTAGAKGGELAFPIGDTGWRIVLDHTLAVQEAAQRGRDQYAQFLKLFWITVSLVSLGAFGVVMVVRQADRLAEQRSQFAASAAHELRTPLAGLRMYGEMLAEGLGDPGRHQEYARRIASEAERLGRVVSNVNGYTRLERGNLSVQPKPDDLIEAVTQCIERQRPALEALGAKVSVDLPASLPTARFDRDALAHIVQNLLDNAEKYTRQTDGREIRVQLSAENGQAELRVADNGPGIAEKVRKKLFEPFTRGSEADAPAGLGLGLALTRALARAQGGDVELVPNSGHGAEFRVRVPLAS
jgi:signal transduction histidine kinase